MYDPRQDTAIVQQEDLTMFGRLIFALCCNNLAAMNTLTKALDMMGRQYSADVKTLALYLISKPGPHKVSPPHYGVFHPHCSPEYHTSHGHDRNQSFGSRDGRDAQVNQIDASLCGCSCCDLAPSTGLRLNS